MARFRNIEFLFALFLCGVGLAVAIAAARHGIIQRGRPGAGAFPFLAGCLMILASLLSAARAGRSESHEAGQAGIYLRIGLINLVMIGLFILAEPLGLYLGCAAMMILVGLVCSDPGQRTVGRLGRLALLAFVGAGAIHLFFRLFLRVPLLEGPFASPF